MLRRNGHKKRVNASTPLCPDWGLIFKNAVLYIGERYNNLSSKALRYLIPKPFFPPYLRVDLLSGGWPNE